MVERCGILEHTVHVVELTRFPIADGLVEGGGIVEHTVWVGDIADIPSRDVLVESRPILERVGHIRHCHIPVADVAIGCIRFRLIIKP